jgi:hypothetical protein
MVGFGQILIYSTTSVSGKENIMNKNSIATPFGIWWSLMAGGVMVAENPETVHIFLPYEIIEADAVGDNLIVVTRPDMEGKACSFTLNPESVLPSAAKMAQKAGLPIAQYAVSKIRYAKDDLIRKILQPSQIFSIIRCILTQTNSPKRNSHGHEPYPIPTRLILACIPCAVWH